MAADQYLQLIHQYFEEVEVGGEARLKAKTVLVEIDSDHWIPVPLITLVNPKALSLSRMKVNMSVRIDHSEAKRATNDSDSSELDRSSFQVSLSPPGLRSGDGGDDKSRDSQLTDIEMEFVAGEPSDAFMRLLQAFTHLVDPNNANVDSKAEGKFTSLRYGSRKPGGEEVGDA